MSFYDDASLIMYPSGYKANKIYSLKPTDGSGDLDFTRSNDTATRVNSAGLIEKVRTNLVLQSNTFNTSWVLSNATVSSGATDPNGGSTAWTLNKTASQTFHLYQNTASLTGNYTFSVYAKAGTNNEIRVDFNNAQYIQINLANGSIVSSGGLISNVRENVGDGWWRISISANISSNTLVRFGHGGGSATGSILLWSSQLESGDIATDYIPTTTNAVSVGMTAGIPRIDYTGGGCGKLLLEPQRTNIITFSEQLDNAAWDTTEDLTIIANATTSPDGNINAENVIPDATLAFHRVKQTNTASLSTPYTLSVYVKPNGYNFFLIRTNAGTSNNVGFDLTNGTITFSAPGYSGFISEVGNGWYRLGYVASYDITTVEFGFRSQPTAQTDNTISQFTGDGTSGAFIWGAQLEQGSYATSYIPTLSAASTRGQDACSKTGISELIGQTEGVIFVDFQLDQAPSDANGRLLQVWATNDTTNSIIPLVNQSRQLQITTFNASLGTPVIPSGASTLLELGQNKIAVAYTSTSIVVYRNGVLFASGDPTGCFPTSLTSLDLGGSSFATRNLGNPISQAILFPTRLTNDELASLTTL